MAVVVVVKTEIEYILVVVKIEIEYILVVVEFSNRKLGLLAILLPLLRVPAPRKL